MKMRTILKTLSAIEHCNRGVAAVEMGLLAPVFILFLGLLLDLGIAYSTKLRLVSATTAAAQFAFNNSQSLTSSTVPTFLANIASVATTAADITPAPTVTATFNNATDGSNLSNFYCVTGSSPSTATWSSTGNSSTSCGGNVMSGKFVTISVTTTSSTVFYSSSTIGAVISEQDMAIVRVR